MSSHPCSPGNMCFCMCYGIRRHWQKNLYCRDALKSMRIGSPNLSINCAPLEKRYVPLPKGLSRCTLDWADKPPLTHHDIWHCMFMECCEHTTQFSTKSTSEIPHVVGLQPKFALVDTFSHASFENRQNVGKQSTFPTS